MAEPEIISGPPKISNSSLILVCGNSMSGKSTFVKVGRILLKFFGMKISKYFLFFFVKYWY